MDYGYRNSYGSYGSHGQSLNSDASASERFRIDAAKKERERQEKEKMKQMLTDLERKRDHAKLEVSHHQTEARRLETEIAHERKGIEDLERILAQLQDKEHSLKAHASDAEQELQKIEKEILEKRRQSDDATNALHKLDSQMQQLQHQITEQKNTIYDIGVSIQKMGVLSRQTEMQKHKQEIDAEHAKSERMYKEKDVENKKRALGFLEQKKEHAMNEAQKLDVDIKKMEMEIKMLASRIR